MNRIKGVAFLVLFMAVTVVTLAIQHTVFHAAAKPNKINAEPQKNIQTAYVYNEAVLQKFGAVCQKFNMQKRVFTCSGMINMTDGADSSKTIKNLDFMMCKDGNNCFYKFGNTETLNAEGVYIYIENDQKRVMVTKQKDLVDSPLPDISQISKVLKGDHYNLTDTTKGSNETIAFINEKHITCKEYAVTFDTLSKKVSRIYSRLTNFNDPGRRDRERVIDISIKQCDDSADLNRYMNKYSVIKKTGSKIALTQKYAGYELIVL